MKDIAFPWEPSCTHLAHSLAKQQVIPGGEFKPISAQGQHIGCLRLMDSRACSGTATFSARLHCLESVSGSSDAHRPVLGTTSGVPGVLPAPELAW